MNPSYKSWFKNPNFRTIWSISKHSESLIENALSGMKLTFSKCSKSLKNLTKTVLSTELIQLFVPIII